MRFKQFLIFALGPSLLPGVYAEGRGHGYRSHAHWHPASYHRHSYVFRHGPRYHTSFYFGPSAYYGFGYPSYAPLSTYTYYDEPSAYSVAQPSYAANGLLLGALAGAVIGNNSGDLRHNGWRGAALGATAGYVLGSIADARTPPQTAVVRPDPVASAAASSAAPTATPAATVSPSPPATPASPMAAANTLFGR